MRVQHGSVERRDEEIEICEHDGHGAVDDAVRAVDEALGLVCVPGGIRCKSQWGISDSVVSKCNGAVELENVRQIELRAPSDPRGRACGGRCYVAIVGTNRCKRCQSIDIFNQSIEIFTLARGIPRKEDFLAGE